MYERALSTHVNHLACRSQTCAGGCQAWKFPKYLEEDLFLVFHEKFRDGEKLCLRFRWSRSVAVPISKYVYEVDDLQNDTLSNVQPIWLVSYSDIFYGEKLSCLTPCIQKLRRKSTTFRDWWALNTKFWSISARDVSTHPTTYENVCTNSSSIPPDSCSRFWLSRIYQYTSDQSTSRTLICTRECVTCHPGVSSDKVYKSPKRRYFLSCFSRKIQRRSSDCYDPPLTLACRLIPVTGWHFRAIEGDYNMCRPQSTKLNVPATGHQTKLIIRRTCL